MINRNEGGGNMGKRPLAPGGAFKVFEQEIMKISEKIKKLDEQVAALRDLTWVAADLLNDFGRQKVKITLNDGSSMTGVLERYDRFNLLVKRDKGKAVVVMKHAILAIEMA